MNDFLHRIRWPNVARAAAVLGVVGLLISWPHLRGGAPELPPPAPAAAARPAPVEAADPAPDARGEPRASRHARRKAAERRRARERRSAAARRRGGARHHHRAAAAATGPPASAVPSAPLRPPAPAGPEFKP